MNSKERFLRSMQYKGGFDRFPTKYYGTPEITAELMKHFGLKDGEYDKLLVRLGDDFRHVAPAYIGPELKKYDDGSWEGLWGERYVNYSFGKGTYPEACYLPFEKIENTQELEGYRFPSSDWFDYSDIEKQCLRYGDYVVYIGGADIPDFLNGIARCRGVENVLIDVATENPVYLKLVEQRYEFYYGYLEKTLKEAKGKIDVVCFGEDLGTQNGLMISKKTFDKLFAGKMKSLFSLAHQYGAMTMMHSCGSVRDMIDTLIGLGLDILEVVQVDAAIMAIEELYKIYFKKIGFCGSISVQKTLPFGSVDEIKAEVELRKRLFKDGGIVIAPTHDIQVGTPVENILTMYRAIGSLQD